MPDNQLSIAVVVDASQLNSALPAATAVANDAFTQLAAAQIRVSSASKELRDTLGTLAKSGLQPTAADTEEVAKAMFDAQQATMAFKTAEDEAYGSTERLAAGANNARSAFMGLNRELGLGGNRALSTFISQSETLGPILNQAFTGIAIAGFIQLAVLAADKVSKLIDDTFIFTKAEQDSAAQISRDNKTIQEAYDHHIAALREISMIGLSRTAQDALRLKYAGEDRDYAQRAVDSTSKALETETQKLNVLQQQLKAQKESFSYTGPGAAPQLDFGPKVREQEVVVKNLNSTLGALQAALRTAGDAVTTANKTYTTAEAKDYTTALREASEMADRQRKSIESLIKQRNLELSELKKLAAAETEFFAKEGEKQTVEDVKAMAERAAADRKFASDRQKDTEEEAVAEIAMREKAVQEQLKLGQIGNAQAAAQLKELEIQKLAIEMQYLNDRAAEIQARLATDDAAAYAKDLADFSKLLSEKLKAQTNYQREIQNITNRANTQIEKSSASMIKAIGNDFTRGFVSWMNGQETFGRAMQHVWTQFADTAVSNLLKVGFQMAANYALGQALEDGTKLHDAAAAARKTWVAVASIPIVGPFLAPEAAAAAFAGVMAFESGGLVPGSGPVAAIVHGGELILNQEQQRSLGSGGHTFQYINHGSGSAEQTRASSKEFFKMAKREIRRMGNSI
jgi:hypothetical protein